MTSGGLRADPPATEPDGPARSIRVAGFGDAIGERTVVALFTTAVLLSAALLFVVQPMVGKMVLPRGGGSPEVWNTSLVFFQAALLAGYLYAHYSVRWLGVRRQALLHAGLLSLPMLVLPIALPDVPMPEGGGQSMWILSLLTVAVGAPFFVLATMSPLLQRWLAATGHRAAGDPYFLYAASNAGSMLGLLAYPFVLEPLLPLSVQSGLWTLGYGVFTIVAVLCIFVAARAPATAGVDASRSAIEPASGSAAGTAGGPLGSTSAPALEPSTATGATGAASAPTPTGLPEPSPADRRFWVAAAAIPSALLLGVTHFLTGHIASLPLLWVLPLAVYLGTFIVAFARWRVASVEAVSRALAIVAVVLTLTLLARMTENTRLLVLLHLVVLAAASLLCHLRLADRRPAPTHLTEFYLLVALGGVLGGAFSALVAPYVFDSVAEYPIALTLAALLRVGAAPDGRRGRLEEQGNPGETAPSATHGRVRPAPHDQSFPVASPSPARSRGLPMRRLDLWLAAALAVYLFVGQAVVGPDSAASDAVVVVALAFVPAVALYLLSSRRVAFALGLALLMGFAESGQMYRGELLHAERTFFGVYRVLLNPTADLNVLYHGATVHGIQARGEKGGTEPLAYYHRTGPAGRVLSAMASRPDKRDIALVGGGTGALTALAGAHQHVTIYEIDEAVVRIAEDPRYFTFLANSRAPYETVLGDGRVALSRTDRRFDTIVLDAFSSGAIPLHLLTREALQLYLDRLAPGGVLLFHISNRHLALAPVLAAHARDLGLVAFENIDVRAEDHRPGISSSHWVIMARNVDDLAYIPSEGWRPLVAPPDAPVWTDDFSNLLSVQRWN